MYGIITHCCGGQWKYNNDGLTPIHIACKKNNIVFLQETRKSDYFYKDAFECITASEQRMQTPLMIAIENYNFEIVEALCSFNGDPQSKIQINEARDIYFGHYNELEYGAFYFIKSKNDATNNDYNESFRLFKLMFKTLLEYHKIRNGKQLIEYNNDTNNDWNKIDKKLIKSLMNIVNEYVKHGKLQHAQTTKETKETKDYNEQLKEWIDKLFIMFKKEDYQSIVHCILNPEDDTKSNETKMEIYIQEHLQCPKCKNQKSKTMTQSNTSNSIQCIVCGSDCNRHDQTEFYQCNYESNHMLCWDCGVVLVACKLLVSGESHLFDSFMIQHAHNRSSIEKMFIEKFVSKYCHPSDVLFYICQQAKNLKLELIEKFIQIAPLRYINKIRNQVESV